MKNLYYIIILLICLPALISAQTITQSDLPIPGVAFSEGHDATYTGAVPPGGMNQTWNFSNLQALTTDTTAFISSTGTTYASTFPTSNLATFNDSDTSYVYFVNNANGLFINGFASSTGNEVFNPSPGLLIIPVPFSYSNTRNNVARVFRDFDQTDTLGNVHHLRIVHRVESNFEGDGTGTLTIPTGVYSNVLRVKITEVTWDSLYVDTFSMYVPIQVISGPKQITHFRYLKSGSQGNYLLGIDADSLGTTSTSSQYYIATLALSVINPVENKNIPAYPNPASDILNFKLTSENSTIVLYDNYGKQLSRSQGSENKRLNISDFKNGVYYYEIIEGDKIEKGSFVVQH